MDNGPVAWAQLATADTALVTTSWADLGTVYSGINTFILEYNNVPEYGQYDGQGWVLCPLYPLCPG